MAVQTPALYMIVTNTDDGYGREENVRVIVTDTQAEAEEETRKMVGTYTWLATLYAVTDKGYRGERLLEARK